VISLLFAKNILKLDTDRIKEIRNEINQIFRIVYKPSLWTDYNRYYFLRTEIDTLIAALNLSEEKNYKESFILLRTVLEKFLFFWLMHEGKMYRWTITYNIQPIFSKTPKEARDATMELWRRKRGPVILDS